MRKTPGLVRTAARSAIKRTLRASWLVLLVVGLGVLWASPALAADHWTDISDAQWLSQYNVSAQQAATVAQGYPNGDGTWRFEPAVSVKRGQFAKMSVSGLGIDTLDPAAPTFVDVPKGSTFYIYVEGAAEAELVQGWTLPSGRYFRPGDSIARQQANSILGRYLSDAEMDASGVVQGQVSAYPSLQAWYEAEGDFYLKGFGDWSAVAAVHRPATAYLVFHGVVKGGNGVLNPTATLTRAQAVALIIRVEHEVQAIILPPAAPTGVATLPVSPSSDTSPYVVGQTIVDGRVAVYDTHLNATTEVAQGNADATGEFSVRVPGLAEGLHILTVRVRNEHNKISAPSAEVPYVVDTIVPAGEFTAPEDGGAVASFQPRLMVAVADSGAGVQQVLFQYRPGATGAFASIGVDVSTPYEATWGDLDLPGDGAYQFQATMRDYAGNEATVGPIDVIVDTTKPTVTLTAPSSGDIFYSAAPTLLFAADAADPAPAVGVPPSGVRQVDFLYALRSALPADPLTWSADDFTHLWTSTAPGYSAAWGDTTLPDGDYMFAVQSTDRAGNKSELDTQRVIVDNAAPVIALQEPAPGEHVPDETAYAIRWSIADVSPVGAVRIEVSPTGEAPWTAVAAAAPNTGEFVWNTPDASGDPVATYKIRLTATDGAAGELGAGHTTEYISQPFTLVEEPAPATGLAASNPVSGGTALDGRDFHLEWAPSTSADADQQSIFILPVDVLFDASPSPVAVDIIPNETTGVWTGSDSLTRDSLGALFDPAVHYQMYVLTSDTTGAQTLSAASDVPWPAAPTAVTASDIDASAGVTAADIQATWVPSTSSGVVSQEVYVLPAATPIDLSATSTQSPAATLLGNALTVWHGDPGSTLDSANGALAAGAYRMWVVAVGEDGHKVPSAFAAVVVSSP